MVQERKIALLVDAENVSHHRIDQVMAAVKNNLGGLVTVKRIYADWTKPNLSAWKAVLQKHAFLPIQQYSFTSGKNSTDLMRWICCIRTILMCFTSYQVTVISQGSSCASGNPER